MSATSSLELVVIIAKVRNPFARSWLFFGSNNLVVAGSEQENWAAYHREINRASERAWMQPKGI